MGDENTPENPNRRVEELLKSVDANLKELAKLQRQTLDQSTKQFRDDRTYKETNRKNTAAIADAVGGGAGAEGGGKQKSKLGALGGAAKTFTDPGEFFKSALFMTAMVAYGRTVNALTRVVTKLTPNIKGLADIEKRAASINLEVNRATVESGTKLAEAIGKEVLSTDALKFAFASHEVGIATHGKGMRNLFRATLRTGEDFKRLTSGIRDALAGMGDGTQLDVVAFSINRLSGVLNKTRTELVHALGQNSAKLKDSLAVLSGNSAAYQQATMTISGLVRDPQLFSGILQDFESLFVGPEGLQKSMMLGVLQQRGDVLRGTDRDTTLKNLITTMKAGFERTELLVGPFRGTQIAPQMLDALTKSGRVNARLFRAWRMMEGWLKRNLGSGDLNPDAIVEKLKTMEANQKDFVDTFDTFKTAVMRPIMNALIEVAGMFKGFFKNNAGTMESWTKKIAEWTIKVYNAITAGFQKLLLVLDKTGQAARELAMAYAGLAAFRFLQPRVKARWAATAGPWSVTKTGISGRTGQMWQRAVAPGTLTRARSMAGTGIRDLGRGLKAVPGAAMRGVGKFFGPIATAAYLGYALTDIWGETSRGFDAIDDGQADIASILAGIKGDTTNMSTIATQNQTTANTHQMLLNNIQQFASAQIKQTSRVIEALGTLGNLSEEQILAIREEKELNVEMMVPFTPTAAPGVGGRGFHPSTRRR